MAFGKKKKKVEIITKECPMCGSTEIGLGYPCGDGGYLFTNGNAWRRSRTRWEVCGDCGYICAVYADNPSLFSLRDDDDEEDDEYEDED